LKWAYVKPEQSSVNTIVSGEEFGST